MATGYALWLECMYYALGACIILNFLGAALMLVHSAMALVLDSHTDTCSRGFFLLSSTLNGPLERYNGRGGESPRRVTDKSCESPLVIGGPAAVKHFCFLGIWVAPPVTAKAR